MFEVRADAEWHGVEGHPIAQRDHRFVIQVVVVVVGDHDCVDVWQLIERQGRSVETLGPLRAEG